MECLDVHKPILALVLHLSPYEFNFVFKYRLGFKLYQNEKSTLFLFHSGSTVVMADRALSSHGLGNLIARYDCTQNRKISACSGVQLSPIRKKNSLLIDNNSRVGDMFLSE